MGRKDIIPDIEARIGQPLKTWMEAKIREGKQPPEIAEALGVGKSKVYEMIKLFKLKDVQKEAARALGTGKQTQLSGYIDQNLAEKRTAGGSDVSRAKDRDLWKQFSWWLEYANIPATIQSILDENVILKYFTYLQTEKERFGRKFKQGVGQSTLFTYQARIHAFIRWLQFKNIIADTKQIDPFSRIRRFKIPKKLPEDMDDSIIDLVLGSFTEDFQDVRDKTIMMWFLETGMRLGGVTRLTLNQFNWETGKGKVIEKGDKERTIVMSDILKVQVLKYLKYRETKAGKLQHLWINAKGQPLTSSGIENMTAKWNKIPGVKAEIARLNPGNRFHAHLFRHIWAKHLAMSEVPGFAMMVMGGWEDLELVQHYAAAYGQERAWKYINTASPLSNLKKAKGE